MAHRDCRAGNNLDGQSLGVKKLDIFRSKFDLFSGSGLEAGFYLFLLGLNYFKGTSPVLKYWTFPDLTGRALFFVAGVDTNSSTWCL